MATNPFVNNITYKPTQNLLEELSIESIKMYGLDVYYIPRRFTKKNYIFGEDPLSYFKDHFKIEAFVENATAFEGEGILLGKFGVEVQQNITLTISRKRFAEEATKIPTLSDRPVQLTAPTVGDLFYFPLSKALFEIKFIDTHHVFFQQGQLYTYSVNCELFKYSMEEMDTGNTEIDSIQQDIVGEFGTDTDPDKKYIMDVKTDNDNEELQLDGDNIIDFTEKDPFSQGNY
jgi:hypothetical protein